VRWYSDPDCTENPSAKEGTDLSFYAVQMEDPAVKLSSTIDVVGSMNEDNELVVSFTPGAPLAPTKMGVIVIHIPMWYNIGNGAK